MNEGKRSSVGAAAPESGIPLGEWRDGAVRFAAEPNGGQSPRELEISGTAQFASTQFIGGGSNPRRI